jgi:hypothetical protein
MDRLARSVVLERGKRLASLHKQKAHRKEHVRRFCMLKAFYDTIKSSAEKVK